MVPLMLVRSSLLRAATWQIARSEGVDVMRSQHTQAVRAVGVAYPALQKSIWVRSVMPCLLALPASVHTTTGLATWRAWQFHLPLNVDPDTRHAAAQAAARAFSVCMRHGTHKNSRCSMVPIHSGTDPLREALLMFLHERVSQSGSAVSSDELESTAVQPASSIYTVNCSA
jgi:hypothetical protein